MKFHHLNHLCDDSEKLSNIGFLEATLFERFNAFFKREFKKLSMKRATKMKQTSVAVEPAPKKKHFKEVLRLAELTGCGFLLRMS